MALVTTQNGYCRSSMHIEVPDVLLWLDGEADQVNMSFYHRRKGNAIGVTRAIVQTMNMAPVEESPNIDENASSKLG